jgi:hypothetical protein
VETVPGSYELPFAVQQWVLYGGHLLTCLAS